MAEEIGAWTGSGLTKGEWEDVIALGEHMFPAFEEMVKGIKHIVYKDKLIGRRTKAWRKHKKSIGRQWK